MSELHLMMLIGYLAATSLRVRMVPNLRAGFTEDRNSYKTRVKEEARAQT